MDKRAVKELRRGYPMNSRVKLLESELVVYGKVAGYGEGNIIKVAFETPEAAIMEVPVTDIIRVTPAEYKKYQEEKATKALAAVIVEELLADEPKAATLDVDMTVAEVIEKAEQGTQFEVKAENLSPFEKVIAEVPKAAEINTAGTTTGRIQIAAPNQANGPKICPPPGEATQAATIKIVGGENKTLADIIREKLIEGKSRAEISKELGTSYQYVYAVDKKLSRK